MDASWIQRRNNKAPGIVNVSFAKGRGMFTVVSRNADTTVDVVQEKTFANSNMHFYMF